MKHNNRDEVERAFNIKYDDMSENQRRIIMRLDTLDSMNNESSFEVSQLQYVICEMVKREHQRK